MKAKRNNQLSEMTNRFEVRLPSGSNRTQSANCSPPLRRFFGVVLPRREVAEMNPATRYTLWRNSASMMKIRHIFEKTCLLEFCEKILDLE